MNLYHTEIAPLLLRINTASLKRPDIPTVALIVFNTSEHYRSPTDRVRFETRFQTLEMYPVTVRDDSGTIVPSRIRYFPIYAAIANQPAGIPYYHVQLDFELGKWLLPRTGRAYGASFEENPLGINDDLTSPYPLPIYETQCHAGELPAEFALPESFSRR